MAEIVIGVISDVHSNREGQRVALEFLRKEGVDFIYDLGDVVGMFPGCIEPVLTSMSECDYHVVGNHDAMAKGDFEDNPKRLERILALHYNRLDIAASARGEDILEHFGEIPVRRRENGIVFVHNSPIHTNRKSETDMHFRYGKGMKDLSYINELLGQSEQLVVRGHSHRPHVHRIRRDLALPIEEKVELIYKPRPLILRPEEGRTWEVDIDPDFKYVLTVGSACGANTMFTPDNVLDYRPAVMILRYDPKTGRGKATFVNIVDGYNHELFVKGVREDARWNDREKFPEAMRQVEYLSKGMFFGPDSHKRS